MVTKTSESDAELVNIVNFFHLIASACSFILASHFIEHMDNVHAYYGLLDPGICIVFISSFIMYIIHLIYIVGDIHHIKINNNRKILNITKKIYSFLNITHLIGLFLFIGEFLVHKIDQKKFYFFDPFQLGSFMYTIAGIILITYFIYFLYECKLMPNNNDINNRSFEKLIQFLFLLYITCSLSLS